MIEMKTPDDGARRTTQRVAPELARTLIVAPHPDDDAIATGGLMQKVLASGGRLRILFVTDGESNPWPQRFQQRKIVITAADRAEWGALRRAEAICSLASLGVPSDTASFLGFPDQRMSSLLFSGDQRLPQRLVQEIEQFRPTLIAAPSKLDLHPDHRAISCFVHDAVKRAAVEHPALVTYVIHGGADDHRLSSRFELTAEERQRKRAAIACHVSQLALSRERFLAHARSSEMFYLPEDDLERPGRLRLWSGWMRHVFRVLFWWPKSEAAPVVADPDTPSERKARAAHV